jgi:hypothetical protein
VIEIGLTSIVEDWGAVNGLNDIVMVTFTPSEARTTEAVAHRLFKKYLIKADSLPTATAAPPPPTPLLSDPLPIIDTATRASDLSVEKPAAAAAAADANDDDDDDGHAKADPSATEAVAESDA